MKVSQRGHWGEEQDRVICGLTGTSSGYCKETVVSWCCEPSQPQRITLGLKTNFTVFPTETETTCMVWA